MISGTNPNTGSPAYSTTEIPAQGTPEPNIRDTTDQIGMRHQECPRK